MKKCISLAIVLTFATAFLPAGMAQTGYTILHSFAGFTSADGDFSQGGLVSDGSALYGTTSYGGTSDYGTIFTINPDGSDYTVLRNFSAQSQGGSCRLEIWSPTGVLSTGRLPITGPTIMARYSL